MQFQSQVYYWRTTGGVEVDFVVYGRDNLIAFKIKHAKNITPAMIRGLRHFKEDYPMATLYIIYLGSETLYLTDQITAVPFEEALRNLPEWLRGNYTNLKLAIDLSRLFKLLFSLFFKALCRGITDGQTRGGRKQRAVY